MSTFKIGFDSTKGADGQVTGAGKVKLVHRNPYEMVGLKRPVSQVPGWVKKAVSSHSNYT